MPPPLGKRRRMGDSAGSVNCRVTRASGLSSPRFSHDKTTETSTTSEYASKRSDRMPTPLSKARRTRSQSAEDACHLKVRRARCILNT
jgi:hypothetical protein